MERLTTDGLDKRRPSWSPDGKTLAFARTEPDGEHLWQFLKRPGDRGQRRLVPDRETPQFDAVFSPDGRRLLLTTIRYIGTQGNVDVAVVDPASGMPPIPVATEEVSQIVHQEWPAWSPDGKRFAYSSTHEGNQEIYTAKLDGTDVVRLTQHPGHDAHPCWSPDGSRIVFATDRFGGGLELASIGPDGTGLRRITTSPGLDDFPAYAPDGKSLAFVSNRDGQHELYLCRPDGSSPRNLTRHPSRDSFPTWTPDGRSITFVSDRDGGIDLYTIRLDSSSGQP